MSDKAKLLEETKKNISSLLVSAGATEILGRSLTANQIEKDYREMIDGKGIPVRAMGYTSIEDFYRAIPDIVSMKYSGNQLQLQGISNQKTDHISRMISRQAKKPKASEPRNQRGRGGRGRGPNRPYLYGGHRRSPLQYRQPTNYYQSYQPQMSYYGGYSAYQQPFVQPLLPTARPLLPTPSRGTARAPVRCVPAGYETPPSDPDDNFHMRKPVTNAPRQPGARPVSTAQSGASRPVSSGPRETARPVSTATREPARPVSRNKPEPKPPIVPVKIRLRLCEILTSYPNGLLGSNVRQVYGRAYSESLQPEIFGFASVEAMLSTLSDAIKLEEIPSGGYKVHLKPISPMVPGSKSRIDTTSNSAAPPSNRRDYSSDGKTFSPDLIRDIQAVLSKFPNGVRSSHFQDRFEKHTGKALPVRDLGYISIIDMVNAMPELVTIERPNNQDWVLYDVKSHPVKAVSKPKQPKSPVKSKTVPSSTAPPVGNRVKETIRQVLKVYKGGIDFYKFEECYKTCTGTSLSYLDLGFPSLANMFLSMTDVVQIDYSKKGAVTLVGLGPPIDPQNCLLKRIPSKQDQEESRHPNRIPADAIGPGVSYNVESVALKDQFIQVTVSHVESPGYFWVQMEEQGSTLEELMDYLEYCYCSAEGDKYRMPDEMIAIGQVCVAIFAEDENWHRVTISSIKNLDYVECFFVDYGTISSVHRQNIRLLKNKFFKFPAQAIRSKLYGLVPVNGKTWSVESRNRMLELTTDRKLIGIVPTDPQNGVIAICLTDTSGEEDVHVNDVLISEGHAIADRPTEEPDDSDDNLDDLDDVTDAEELSLLTAKKEEERRYREALEMGLQPRHVMCVQLLDDLLLHIIKYRNRPWIVGNQISLLLKQEDSLRSQLRKQKNKFNFELLAKEDNPEIFEVFDQYEVPGTVDSNGQVKNHVTVYPLESVVDIMKAVGNPSAELIEQLHCQVKEFDPEDPYWLGEDDDESEESSIDTEWNLQDCENALHTLVLRRRRIVQAMASGDESQQKNYSVDDLAVIEKNVFQLQQKIAHLKGQSIQPSNQDDFIQTCIAQQYGAVSSKEGESGVTSEMSKGGNGSKVQVVQPMPSTTATTATSQAKVQPSAAATSPMNVPLDLLSGTPGLATPQSSVAGAMPGMPGMPNMNQSDLTKMMQDFNAMQQLKVYMDMMNMSSNPLQYMMSNPLLQNPQLLAQMNQQMMQQMNSGVLGNPQFSAVNLLSTMPSMMPVLPQNATPSQTSLNVNATLSQVPLSSTVTPSSVPGTMQPPTISIPQATTGSNTPGLGSAQAAVSPSGRGRGRGFLA